jgi:hypothetical protein
MYWGIVSRVGGDFGYEVRSWNWEAVLVKTEVRKEEDGLEVQDRGVDVSLKR